MKFLDVNEKSNHDALDRPVKVALTFNYITDGVHEKARYEREGWFSDSMTGVQWWSEYIGEDMVGMEIPGWTIQRREFNAGKMIALSAFGDTPEGGREQVVQGLIVVG